MTRWPAVVALLALLAGPASAVEVDRLAERLREDPVLVEQGSAVQIDEEAVLEAVEQAPVPTYVLLLPQREVDRDESGIDGVLLRVVEALQDPRAVVVVVTDGGELQAGEGGSSGVAASALLDRILQERSAQSFDGRTLTDALVEFAEGVREQGEEGAQRGVTGSGPRTVALAGLVGFAVVAAGVLWLRSQRQVRDAAPGEDADTDGGGW